MRASDLFEYALGWFWCSGKFENHSLLEIWGEGGFIRFWHANVKEGKRAKELKCLQKSDYTHKFWRHIAHDPPKTWHTCPLGTWKTSALYACPTFFFHSCPFNRWRMLSFGCFCLVCLLIFYCTQVPQNEMYQNSIGNLTTYEKKSQSDRGTQKLKILAFAVVDRLKWLMHVESCYSRNWNTLLCDSRRLTSNSTFVLQRVRKQWRQYLSHCVPGREPSDADKELLIKRCTRKSTSGLQLLPN